MGGGRVNTLIVIILAVCCLLLLIAVIVLAILLKKNLSDIDSLSASIEEYLKGGEKTDFSVRDNRFARLQNGISDLQNTLETQKANRIEDNRCNADFIADVSHQLKTPVAGLRLYSEMADAENSTTCTQAQLSLISKTEHLISELLRLQKLKSDAFSMNFARSELSDLLGNLVSDFIALFPDKNISVIGQANFSCDSSWLSEAFGNIIKNACEHTPENGRIEITIAQTESNVSVVFEDNGGGVSEEEIPMLFNRFYKSETSSPASTGLGLAISREIISKHHGSLFAENGREGLKITAVFPVLAGSERI